MRRCPYCKIDVGGALEKCPLCQSKLSEGVPAVSVDDKTDADINEHTMDNEGIQIIPYFPRRDTLQLRSFLYKLQLFIVWMVMIIALCMDFLIAVRLPGMPDFHWSLILSMWLVVFEFGIIRQFRPGTGSARKVTMMVFLILVMLSVTAYFFGFLKLTLDLIIPVVLTGTVIASFVLTMVDKNGNAMAYLLSDLVFGVIPCLVLFILNKEMPIAWVICMTVSVILLVGVVVFKGRLVATELHRRFNV